MQNLRRFLFRTKHGGFSCSAKRFKTIYALSSGSLPSAIAMVRISGSASEEALRRLTGRSHFEPMRLFYNRFVDEKGEVLDKGMACFMKGPKTFTGEDCAELYLHGSKAVVDAVFVTLSKIPGLESAKAGEFSKRAFYNGKMDALQVEALAGLIGAETESQRILALRQAKSSKYLRTLRGRLVHLSADIEGAIDFGEELADGATIEDTQLRTAAEVIRAELVRLQRSAVRCTLIRSGIHVALVGRTNVGKSSIMNRLAERDVAIVSNIPGTTRDSVQLRLRLGSNVLHVTDTAGIRDTNDSIEREGILRSIQRAKEANIIVLVVDRHDPHLANEDIKHLIQSINYDPVQQSLIVCFNKTDLMKEPTFRVSEILPQNVPSTSSTVWTSCQEENGLKPLIDELESLISNRLSKNNLLTEDCSTGNELVLSNHRHIQLLERALDEMECFNHALGELNDRALAAHHLQQCAAAIGEISGDIVHNEIMECLFSKMCIGK